MMLEAVWFKDGNEVYRVSPVMNLLCDDEMRDIAEIEVYNGSNWYSCEDVDGGADGFVIIIKED